MSSEDAEAPIVGPAYAASVVVDPRVTVFLSMLRASGWPSMSSRTPRQARNELRSLAAATGTWQRVRSVADAVIDGPAGDIPVRVYRPGRPANRDRPLVVYFHGGGFVIGDLFTADGLCRRLANASRATVVSVHYRRAPEFPLPAAQSDAYCAARWALTHAEQLGADPSRLVVAGDSAGGALAAHVAQRLRDEGPIGAALQVLINPATDLTLENTDRAPALARLLDWQTIDWFGEQALPPSLDRTHPTISPHHAADLAGVAPAFVVTAGVDPFRSDGINYALALGRAGVESTLRDFPGQIHGFVDMDLIFPAAKTALRATASAVASLQPVPVPDDLASDEPIRWVNATRGNARRAWEGSRRLPPVNATQMLLTLLDARARSTLALLAQVHQRPGGPR